MRCAPLLWFSRTSVQFFAHGDVGLLFWLLGAMGVLVWSLMALLLRCESHCAWCALVGFVVRGFRGSWWFRFPKRYSFRGPDFQIRTPRALEKKNQVSPGLRIRVFACPPTCIYVARGLVLVFFERAPLWTGLTSSRPSTTPRSWRLQRRSEDGSCRSSRSGVEVTACCGSASCCEWMVKLLGDDTWHSSVQRVAPTRPD